MKAVVWLSLEKTPPIQADAAWHGLSFTQKHPQGVFGLDWPCERQFDSGLGDGWHGLRVMVRRQAAEGTQPYPVDTDGIGSSGPMVSPDG